jgi:hypothetical protein
MIKKLSLIAIASICMVAIMAPAAMAYTWQGSSWYGIPGSATLGGKIVGVSGSPKWVGIGGANGTIHSAVVYARNKGKNADNANATKFTGLDYDVGVYLPDKQWEEADENGTYWFLWYISDQECIQAVLAENPDLDLNDLKPNRNWTVKCVPLLVFSDWDLYSGEKGECYQNPDGSPSDGCSFDETCDVTFSGDDLEALQEFGYSITLNGCIKNP